MERGGAALGPFTSTQYSRSLLLVLDLPLCAPSTGAGDENAPVDLDSDLPEFLLMDVGVDLELKGRLEASGGGTVFRGQLHNAVFVARNASTVCAAKEVAPIASLSEEACLEAFYREISILWALAYHPNVLRLVGFCVAPQRLIVTHLYKTDLYRYLHGSGRRAASRRLEPLESYQVLYMCTGMAAALAATHALGVAHRDIKTPNFLLDDPPPGSLYPNPILCDFGLARTPNDTVPAKLKGMAARYAAPEVFARMLMSETSNSIEDDMAADVYSLGVVFWETTCRAIPWNGVPADEIQAMVAAGARLPDLNVDDGDVVWETVNRVIRGALQVAHDRRPAAVDVHAPLNECIRAFFKDGDGDSDDG